MMGEALDIRTTQLEDTLFIALSGELDMDCSEDMESVQTRIKDGDLSAVELDLTGLAYLDSVGLMQIARLYRVARARVAPLTVHVRDGSHIQQVLRLIGAGDLFEVVIGPVQTAFPS